MNKIPTIYDRDWQGNRGVVDKTCVEFDFSRSTATEKLDGTNVRLTVRSGLLVRLEKRCNPNKDQKRGGIVDPWYVDAIIDRSEDKHLWDAALNTEVTGIPDGEWSGEAVGPKIQGNPLGLDGHIVVLFSVLSVQEALRKYPPHPDEFEAMREWLKAEKSGYGEGFVEGIVWHATNWPGEMVKIKTKDFK